MKTIVHSLRLLAALTLLTGGLYPLAVWAVGQTFFRESAEGSLRERGGHVVGSTLLAQATVDPRYFWPRPSAGDYGAVPSGASNLAWTSAKLRENTVTQARRFRAENGLAADLPLPAEVCTTSGSGLDPELSPAAVALQIPRVARNRGLPPERITRLVEEMTQTSALGPRRINLLELNLKLDLFAP